MEALRQEKLKKLIEQTLTLPPEQRTAFLDDACADDTALRDELDSLLAHTEETLFESLAGAVLPPGPATSARPDEHHR